MQYSDDAQTEFRLNTYKDKGMAYASQALIKYRGGNTKTGSLHRHPDIPQADTFPVSQWISLHVLRCFYKAWIVKRESKSRSESNNADTFSMQPAHN